jgi:ABC-type uncharacterized transport system substrate-binding protein
VKKPLAVAVLLLAAAANAAGHPHVFIDNRMTLAFDAGTLKGILVSWTFDKMFSATMFADFPAKPDGTYDPRVAADLKAGAFDNLSNYHYFLAFQVAGKPLKKITIQKFVPTVTNGTILVYSFFVPLDIPLTSADQTVRVTVYDDSYYVAFSPMHVEDMTVTGSDGVSCRLSVEKTTVKPAWPGQYMPDQLVIRMRKAP